MYLDSVIPALAMAGHQIAFLHEDEPSALNRVSIAIPSDSPVWCTARIGREHAVRSLKRWNPDVSYTHGLRDPKLEAAVVSTGASVMYVHNYYGTCISGHKTHNTSPPRPCDRKFGATCLVRYFPQHCGGSNPLTMWQMYRLNSRRLQLMRRYRKLMTNSRHLVRELARYNLAAECIRLPVTAPPQLQPADTVLGGELRLVFAARFMSFKGGQYLLGALQEVRRRLQKKLRAIFAGDGPERSAWEQIASGVRSDDIAIEFSGWLSPAELQEILACSHLLVYPSLAPEPFGLSGLEAGRFGVPSVAFAVGGVPEWLHDGVNGHLASVVTTQSLADAITRSLQNPEHYAHLRQGAYLRAQEYSLSSHIAQLVRTLTECTA